MFFTPELFEGEGDEGGEQEETKAESRPELVLGATSTAAVTEELLGSEPTHVPGHASALDGQSAVSVSEESTGLSQGKEEEVRGQKQYEEGEGRQTGSRRHRLSRSRQKVSSTQTGV